MGLRLALAIFMTWAFLAPGLSAQRQGRGYAGVTVYDSPDFRGTNRTFREEIPDLRLHGLNDRITSLEVDGNQAWEVCQDINFGGRCRVFTGSIEDLREEGWNDRISSLRPAGSMRGGRGNVWGTGDSRGRGRVERSRLVFYERPNFRGASRDILNGTANLGSVGDRVESVRVYGGTWQLCDDASRNARCVTVSEDVPNLRSLGLRNGVASVREVAGQDRRR